MLEAPEQTRHIALETDVYDVMQSFVFKEKGQHGALEEWRTTNKRNASACPLCRRAWVEVLYGAAKAW